MRQKRHTWLTAWYNDRCSVVRPFFSTYKEENIERFSRSFPWQYLSWLSFSQGVNFPSLVLPPYCLFVALQRPEIPFYDWIFRMLLIVFGLFINPVRIFGSDSKWLFWCNFPISFYIFQREWLMGLFSSEKVKDFEFPMKVKIFILWLT